MRIRGLPQERAAYSAGQICAVLANIHRKEDAKVFAASDFVVQITLEDVEASQETEQEETDADAEIDIAADLEARSNAIAKMLGRKPQEKS